MRRWLYRVRHYCAVVILLNWHWRVRWNHVNGYGEVQSWWQKR